MSIEEQIKKIILDNYKSIRDFSIKNNMSYTTVHTILNRGVTNASITSIMDICNALNIDIDSFPTGIVSFKQPKINAEFLSAYNEIKDYMSLKDSQKEVIKILIETFKNQNAKESI